MISEIKKLLNGINSQLGITEDSTVNKITENFPRVKSGDNTEENESRIRSGESPRKHVKERDMMLKKY